MVPERRPGLRGVPEPSVEPSNDRFKRSYPRLVAGALVVAVAAHVALFELFPTLRVADLAVGERPLEAIELPPQVEVPPPPAAIARPATPRIATAELSEEVTIAETTFDANPVEDLPPPPPVVEETDPSERPTFIDYDVPPVLRNADEIRRLLRELYPPALEEAGIGGRVVLWVYVDVEGRVQRTRVRRGSGYGALDTAAGEVAARMQFRPAMNRDRRTAVWVQQAIDFVVQS